MKKYIFAAFLFLNTYVCANTKCFIASQDGVIQQEDGDCNTRHPPCSTFKIAISLMGYNEGILQDELKPKIPFQTGYLDVIDAWKQEHNPTNWMQNSCVWYSYMITKRLGIEKFKHYIAGFDYGNMNVLGDDALTRSWLSSTLKISGFEQIAFLQKFLDGGLPVNQKSHELARNILFVEDLNGWKLYGKTGSGDALNDDGSVNKNRQIGWFVGWIQKEDRRIIFANYIEDTEKLDYSGGKCARESAKEKLIKLTTLP